MDFSAYSVQDIDLRVAGQWYGRVVGDLDDAMHIVTLQGNNGALARLGRNHSPIELLTDNILLNLPAKYVQRITSAALSVDFNQHYSRKRYLLGDKTLGLAIPGEVHLYYSIDTAKELKEYHAGLDFDPEIQKVRHADMVFEHRQPLQRYVPADYWCSPDLAHWVVARVDEDIYDELSEIDNLSGLVYLQLMLN